jgi:hypothetical protein
MIPGNLSQNKELQEVMQSHPNEGIDGMIKESNKHCYNFIGLRAKQEGIKLKLTWHKFSNTVESWMNLDEQLKKPQYMGGWQQVIMIHNPTIPEPTPEPKPKPRGRKPKVD